MSVISRTAAFGLGAAALVSAGLAQSAAAQAPPAAATSHNYTYSTVFTTPVNYLPTQGGDIRFVFAPDGPNPASATITGGSLSFTGAWGVNLTGITPFGASTLNPFTQVVTIGNSTPINGFQVPISQWGTSFSLFIAYADPPGTDPSDFSVTLQAPGQADTSLMDLGFSPSGTVTLMSSAPGVAITPGVGSPAPTPPSVPEASTTVSLGLMLTLGMGGVILARKKKTG